MKHNNVIPNNHFRKHWQERVRVMLDQAGRKTRRRTARVKKAIAIAPRPVGGALRPQVQCQTIKYNTRSRLGRGFTLEELKQAGINRHAALGIGISVDHRRRNKSAGTLAANVQRLKQYKAKLVVFPRDPKNPKKSESTGDALKTATQLTSKTVMPLKRKAPKSEFRALTAEEKAGKRTAFYTLRKARADARLHGQRRKRAAEKKAEEEATKKK